MEHVVELKNVSGLAFDAKYDKYEIKLDSDPKFGGQDYGMRPKPLLLVSLGGCTAMDVASLLKKMRAEVDEFKVIVKGKLAEEHPKYYTDIKVEYHFFAKEYKKDKIEKAVKLSRERYCGVYYMLEKAANIEYEIIYH